MKIGDKITEKQLLELEKENIYGPNRKEEDGELVAKCGLLMFKKVGSKWELTSDNGIIPKKCNAIRLDANGRAY